MKKALITGIAGQDGQHLTEFLLSKGYEVHGIERRKSNGNPRLPEGVIIHEGDLMQTTVVDEIVKNVCPDEVYNLAAQSHVGTSFKLPEYTAEVTGLGALRLLEAIRRHCPEARYYQASTSELFGNEPAPQNEETRFKPRSPYGCAKMYAHFITVNYRESYNMHASCGILFNHESPIRGEDFVTRKITQGLARIKTGKQDCIYLGNMEAKRDWGFAGDYVKAMWQMLQAPEPDDYVIATGVSFSVRSFVEFACKHFDFVLKWKGEGVEEVGIDEKTGKEIVRIDPKFYRPAEVNFLMGDNTKAREKLGWNPETTLDELVGMMCEHDLSLEQLK